MDEFSFNEEEMK